MAKISLKKKIVSSALVGCMVLTLGATAFADEIQSFTEKKHGLGNGVNIENHTGNHDTDNIGEKKHGLGNGVNIENHTGNHDTDNIGEKKHGSGNGVNIENHTGNHNIDEQNSNITE